MAARAAWLSIPLAAACGRSEVFAFGDDSGPGSLPGEVEPRSGACEGARDELLAYWRFDHAAGPVAHDDAHGHHGEIHGAQRIPDGAFGAALRFAGSDHVTARTDEGLEPGLAVSMTAWVRPVALSADSWDSVVSNGGMNDTKNTYWLGYYHRGVRIHASDRRTNPSLLDDSDYSSHVGAWHHLAATIDTGSGEIAIYVDGELTAISDDAPERLVYDGAPVRIGTDTNLAETQYGFVGDIDEVKLLGCPLDADQVARDAASNWPFPSSAPRGSD